MGKRSICYIENWVFEIFMQRNELPASLYEIIYFKYVYTDLIKKNSRRSSSRFHSLLGKSIKFPNYIESEQIKATSCKEENFF